MANVETPFGENGGGPLNLARSAFRTLSGWYAGMNAAIPSDGLFWVMLALAEPLAVRLTVCHALEGLDGVEGGVRSGKGEAGVDCRNMDFVGD